jgi:DNA-binding XRE family transcriptional regulator
VIVSDLAQIPDPYARFVQSMKFLRSLKETEEVAAEIRNRALLELRDSDSGKSMTLQHLADTVGVSTQRISEMEQQGKSRYNSEVQESPHGD